MYGGWEHEDHVEPPPGAGGCNSAAPIRGRAANWDRLSRPCQYLYMTFFDQSGKIRGMTSDSENQNDNKVSDLPAIYQTRPQLWKPGESGNPKGRPPGTSLRDKVLAILGEEQGTGTRESTLEQFTREMITLARDPNTPAKDRVSLYMYLASQAIGTPRQTIDVSGAEINTVILNLREPRRPDTAEKQDA